MDSADRTANSEVPSASDRGWLGPRTVNVPRARNGFGFTLRHFIVYPPESLPPEEEDGADDIADDDDGQDDSASEVSSEGSRRHRRKRSRMSALEPMDTIFVKQVKDDGPAQLAGLHNGDRIVSVNGQSVSGKSYAQVIALIQNSEQSLKLLVVPKDEDILQMAYRSSAYNQGGGGADPGGDPAAPYRGAAELIPDPPTPTGSTGAGGGRFKSEIRLQPEDEGVMLLGSTDALSHRDSVSSCSSGLPHTDPGGGPGPATPTRTSSKTISLQPQAFFPPDHDRSRSPLQRAGAALGAESPAPSSSSVTSSPAPHRAGARSAAALGTMTPPPAGSRGSPGAASLASSHSSSGGGRGATQQPRTTRSSSATIGLYRPQPYTRSNTANLTLTSSATSTTSTISSSTSSPRRQYGSTSVLDQQSGQRRSFPATSGVTTTTTGRSAADTSKDRFLSPPGTPVWELNPRHRGGRPGSQQHNHTSQSHPADLQFVGARSPLHQGGVNAKPVFSFDQSMHVGVSGFEVASSQTQAYGAGRPSVDRGNINLVTERMKKFESATDSESERGSRGGSSQPETAGSAPSSRLPLSLQPYGCDNVASRAAKFERLTTTTTSPEDTTYLPGSVGHRLMQGHEFGEGGLSSLSSSVSSLAQTQPPVDLQQPSTINIYFRNESKDGATGGSESPAASLRMERSPERLLTMPAADSVGGRSPRSHKPALRQASYLSAVNSPHNQCGHARRFQQLQATDSAATAGAMATRQASKSQTPRPASLLHSAQQQQQQQQQQKSQTLSQNNIGTPQSQPKLNGQAPRHADARSAFFNNYPAPSTPNTATKHPVSAASVSKSAASTNHSSPHHVSSSSSSHHTNKSGHHHHNQPRTQPAHHHKQQNPPHAASSKLEPSRTKLGASSVRASAMSHNPPAPRGVSPAMRSTSGGHFMHTTRGAQYASSRGQSPAGRSQRSESPASRGYSPANRSHSTAGTRGYSPKGATPRRSPSRSGTQPSSHTNKQHQQSPAAVTSRNQSQPVSGSSHNQSSSHSSPYPPVFTDENTPPPDGSTVQMRQSPQQHGNNQLTDAERESKLQRRTSYLMATKQVPSKQQQQQQQQQQQEEEVPAVDVVQDNAQVQPDPPSSEDMTLRFPVSDRESSTSSISQLDIPDGAGNAPITPTKTSNIKKLKAFFGEKTPRILEATERRSLYEVTTATGGVATATGGEVAYDGTLNCKIAVTDGKRASDRSWRPMWAELRGHALYLFKDKANVNPNLCEEQPLSVKNSIVDIAYDYTKKKNVFRLTTYNGSEYLFQAEDNADMLEWIRAIQANNNPDADEEGVGSSELIVRKTLQYQESVQRSATVTTATTTATVGGASPQVVVKASSTAPPPPVSAPGTGSLQPKKPRSMRSKSPAPGTAAAGAQSPGTRHKKNYDKTERLREQSDSPKVKDGSRSGTWKGKMAKKFRRYGSSSSQSVEAPEGSAGSSSPATGPTGSVQHEYEGTFGVPLEFCPPGRENELIPFVVELCCRIVEERGMENQGIYRVPGNTGAVTQLQAALDKAPYLQEGNGFDVTSERLQDVNVVSSLLKAFFRKLPEALITEDLYDVIIQANRIENPEKRMLKLKKVLHDMPEHNFETFQFLAEHLHRVSEKGDLNKMDARNLAIVFGPTLIRTSDESMVTMVKDMSDQCRIIESVISHWQWFFGGWDEDVYVPEDVEPEGSVPISGMNKQLLDKAENLQLTERGRDLSAKDLVSNIFSAANKKIRRRDKTKSGTGDSVDIDVDSESFGWSERNIDQEILLRKGKESVSLSHITGADVSTATTRMSMSSSQLQQQQQRRKDSLVSSSVEEGSWPKFELKKYPAYPHVDCLREGTMMQQTENSKTVVTTTTTRRFSEDRRTSSGSTQGVAGHDELNHHPNAGLQGLTYEAAKQLRALEAETAAALAARSADARRHAAERSRIEAELARTQQELIAEDDDDDEESDGDEEEHGRAGGDNVSIMSDFSTASSTDARMSAAGLQAQASRAGGASHLLPALKEDSSSSPSPPVIPKSPPHRGSLDSLLNHYDPKVATSADPKAGDPAITSTFDLKWRMLHESQPPPSSSGDKWTTSVTSNDGVNHRAGGNKAAGKLNVYASKPPEPGLSLAATKQQQQNGECRPRRQDEDPYVAALRKSTERLYGRSSAEWEIVPETAARSLSKPPPASSSSPASHKSAVSSGGSSGSPVHRQTRAPSPPERSRSEGKRVKRRRYTVGGTQDLEHFKALLTVVPPGASTSARTEESAWARLVASPAARQDTPRGTVDIQDWIQQRRLLRQYKSTPSLLSDSGVGVPPPSSRSQNGAGCYQQQPFTFESSL